MISRRKRMWGRCMIILTEASMPSTKVKTRVDLVMIVVHSLRLLRNKLLPAITRPLANTTPSLLPPAASAVISAEDNAPLASRFETLRVQVAGGVGGTGSGNVAQRADNRNSVNFQFERMLFTLTLIPSQ